jgi:LCP family protein required for cell wall assembly
MTQIRYYRSGDEEPVRVVDRGRAAPQVHRFPVMRVRRRGRLRLVGLLVVVAAAALVVLYGRQAFNDLFAVAGVSSHIRRLPPWLLYAIPLAVCAVVALSAYSLACGRRLVFRVLLVGVLVVVFAAPGFALGWASGLVGTMGQGGTREQKQTVAAARSVLQQPLRGKSVTILLLGIDRASPGDPGRSDSQILVRLDPQAQTISMLSLPRDLRTDIPGLGYAKLNAAYSSGGVKLTIQTFEKLTGVPINHFVRMDFGGFWHLVDVLGGVYLPIDHRYYNPEGTGFQPINLQPGYQLVKAKGTLNFVRFRHDQEGDFTRMVRQQLFLREVQRQSMRWRGDWTRVLKMARAIVGLTTTDLDSLQQLMPIVNMALTIGTAHIYQVHVVGSTPMIGGVSYVVASPSAIATAVHEFENPAPVPGQHAASGTATSSPATASPRPTASPSPSATTAQNQGYDWSAWRAFARHTSLTLEAPTIWSPGLGYDVAGVPFRAYAVETPQKRQVAAAIAVGTVTDAWGVPEYWGVQALRWNDPPAIANPSAVRTIGGRTYLLFYQDGSLHMAAWKEHGATYWVINTLDNVLSNHLLMSLAESCQPVGR